MILRPPEAADELMLLALNNAHAAELSLLDPDRLQQLLRMAFHARVAGDMAGFLIALDQDAPYGSPNFAWFRARQPELPILQAEDADHSGRARPS